MFQALKRLACLLLLSESLLCAMAQRRVTFVEADRGKMPLISRTVSIDSRHDSVYVAYGNERELAALRALGYRYEALPEPPRPKAATMAHSLEEMRGWDRYPTYDVYLRMMQAFAEGYPSLCRIDTIGRSARGRLILCARLSSHALPESAKPQFFYSSTMHGDEVAGYHLMLHLIDTLLSGYGHNMLHTRLLDSLQVFVNPLSNPDGTYAGGDSTVAFAQRYNAHMVDLNRNFPDPFGTPPLDAVQPENEAMMAYAAAHRFRMGANLHGGSEVLNYPWDSFESRERRHPSWRWWQRVCGKFIDTLRAAQSVAFDGVAPEGYIAGGDWYVIPNGRQDYMNATLGVLEVTMEISNVKLLSASRLPAYWAALQRPLVNYMHSALADTTFRRPLAAPVVARPCVRVSPNPCAGETSLSMPAPAPLTLFDLRGCPAATFPAGTQRLSLPLPNGAYVLRCGTARSVIVIAR